MKPRRAIFASILATAAVAAVLSSLELGATTTLARLLLGALALLAVLWALARLLRVYLWKVGRRLAFSYFLIGVLPIPMVALLLLVASYLLAGFFLGHLYRDASEQLRREVAEAATDHLAAFAATGRPGPAVSHRLALAYYRNGRRVAGNGDLPGRFPAWLAERKEAAFVTADGGPIRVAAAARRDAWGVAALDTGDVEQDLSRRMGAWVELIAGAPPMEFRVGKIEIPVQLGPRDDERAAAAHAFFAARSDGGGLLDRPLLWWGEVAGTLTRLEDGSAAAETVAVTLNSNLRSLYRHLFATSAEVDAVAWGSLVALAFLLFDVYAVAALMAVFLIFGISRAVNRLSAATAAVQRGDFSARLPVRRRDQVGALQRSFNEMAAHLGELVATATQKELLEKELAIARDLQKSLIPRDLPASEGIEFATLFEPSAAIGGDYFDILRISERQLAVVVADVSGHGLSTGLRMAMLKAGLLILVGEGRSPIEILGRLDRVVRADTDSRFFVTATIAVVDLEHGHLDLTNAGHPPTYLLREGEVEEILLPGSPLGAIGRSYGHAEVPLAAGDVLVWLSDGLIEATDADDEPFGYRRITEALAGPATSAAEVRDRLLSAVAAHAEGRAAEDDRTLVVLRYNGSSAMARPREA